MVPIADIGDDVRAPLTISRRGCYVARDIDPGETVAGSESASSIISQLEQARSYSGEGMDPSSIFELMADIVRIKLKSDHVSLLYYDRVVREWSVVAQCGYLDPVTGEFFKAIFTKDACRLFDVSAGHLPVLDRFIIDGNNAYIMCLPLFNLNVISGGLIVARYENEFDYEPADLFKASCVAQWLSSRLSDISPVSNLKTRKTYGEQLLSQISASQKEERRRVAADLHDGVAQWMVGAAYELNVCQSLLVTGSSGEVNEALKRLREILHSCLKELRRTISDLRPLPIEQLGFMGAINQISAQLKDCGIECRVDIAGRMPKLSPAEENTVFWIIREAASNIRKHSGASTARIYVQPGEKMMKISISDNGCGFEPARPGRGHASIKSLGLTVMAERADLLGGVLEVASSPGEGSLVKLRFNYLSSLKEL